MKKLVMVSKESVFSGYIKCGMAELADSLANSLGEKYDVTLLVANGHSRMPQYTGLLKEKEKGVSFIRFSKVNYYIIDISLWRKKVIEIINTIQPDIFHNLDEPDLIQYLNFTPKKTVFTFDSPDFASKYASVLQEYDFVNTNSSIMANGILRQRSSLSSSLNNTNFLGIAPGILTEFFSPERGLLIPASYGPSNFLGKGFCKKRLIDTYNLKNDPFICLTMCRLIKEKGLDQIIEQIPFFNENNGFLIVVGKGDSYYEKEFAKLKYKDGVIYIPHWASYVQMPPFLAGADFYLQPSLMENGGIMPLTAMSYGTIPIVTTNGGLADNFNEDNAIIVNENGLEDALIRAKQLYEDKNLLRKKSIYCMQQDISWSSRNQQYIDMYEA